MDKTNDHQTGYALALHGGAGPVAGRDYSLTEDHLRELALDCEDQLQNGQSALDVVQFAVAELERSGLYVAGRGSAPNSAGYVELDASIMDGATRRAGSVAVLAGYQSPVDIARGVMDKTPHVMLAGTGAAAFAAQYDYAPVDDAETYYTTPVGVTKDEMQSGSSHGTVGATALDCHGLLAAATSTGGTFGKLEGRVGDTPLIGPGTWADGHVAISCTGTGEQFIRSGGALAVASAYRHGVPLETAIDQVLDEVRRLEGDGGIIAVSRSGEIATRWNSDGMKRATLSASKALTVATFDG